MSDGQWRVLLLLGVLLFLEMLRNGAVKKFAVNVFVRPFKAATA